MEIKQESIDDSEIIEERADQLTDDEIVNVTAKSDFFEAVHKSLISKGTKLIAGPRGCGKTHLMRYTWIECKKKKTLPLCLYVSFNRYLRLEPYLSKNADAIGLFHSWVLARILLAISQLVETDSNDQNQNVEAENLFETLTGYEVDTINSFINSLESGNSTVYNSSDIELSINTTILAIERTANYFSRKRSVILLDDAALTLTPEYMWAFFDIVRVLKTSSISPKASVYPGTTEYGPKFHVNHEAEMVSIWLDVSSQNYSAIMGEIAENRISSFSEIPADYVEILKYAAFGIPRAFIMMLREFKRKGFKTGQQGINQIIQNHNSWRDSEYNSLAIKIPKFSNLIETGSEFLNEVIQRLKKANVDLIGSNERQIILGIQKFDNPLIKRMISLLVEAGMLYEHSSVSHGEDRTYFRYTPHFSKLIQARAFSGKSRGFSAASIVSAINYKSTKHPIRSTIQNLIGEVKYSNLRINLPSCSFCGTARLNEAQRFCHYCGKALIDPSTFERCMSISLNDIPIFTDWQRMKISEIPAKTIGEFLSLQDPGTELRKLRQIGKSRADRMIGGIDHFVDEFLS